METQQLLADFKHDYSHKYNFPPDNLLGTGAYATVFKAWDIDRNVDVAIKIFHNGAAPAGSQRGWKLTSRTIHPQIAPTHTVETFSANDGTSCKAVVSRFIPGKTLRHVWDKFDTYDEPTRVIIADDFALSLISSLLEVLELCHTLGFGHGDLHAGNIMTFLNSQFEQYTFHVILIDFDNTSFKTELESLSEQEKIDSDIRAVKRLIEATLSDWEWIDAVRILLPEYTSIKDLRIAYNKMLDFIKIIRKKQHTTKRLIDYFVDVLNTMLFKNSKPILNAAKYIAGEAGITAEYEMAFELFEQDLKKYEFWHTSFEMEVYEHGGLKTKVYNDIFG